MSPSVNDHANGGPPVMSKAPSRVTLHLGHLPSKKDIKAPWPRTPMRVSICVLFLHQTFLFSQGQSQQPALARLPRLP